ncbi:hypothetical protein [Aquibacillus saliphilus]|uniref:hypothetical protein n=1 Tax=Aquibacillus saliphilus TaxID=1909422 RepID=UPI001CF039FF|nr:hypothetical protein [Aquibacillus saliphilus]
MNNKIGQILERAGYIGKHDEEGLIDLFLEYVDCGLFANLDWEEAKREIEDGDITIQDIINNMKRVV